MDPARDSPPGHRLQNPVAAAAANRIDMVNVTRVTRLDGRDQVFKVSELLVVGSSVGASGIVCLRQIPQLHAEHRSLNPVHPGIPANQSVMVLLCLPMIPQHLDLIRQLLAVRDNRAGFPEGAQILAAVKAEATAGPKRARPPAFIFGAMRLTCVLNDRNLALGRDAHQRIHVRRQTGGVDGHDGGRAIGDQRLDLRRVHLERRRVDVGEDRYGVRLQNGVDGRDEGVRRDDDFVARADPGCGDRGDQRAGAVGRGEAALAAHQLRVALLELRDDSILRPLKRLRKHRGGAGQQGDVHVPDESLR